MTMASGTATTAEIVTLYQETLRLEVMLRQYNNGDASGGNPGKPGRFTPAQIDTQITALSAAIAAINA